MQNTLQIFLFCKSDHVRNGNYMTSAINITGIRTNLSISESGRVMTITATNGRIIAEILVHGPLKQVIENCLNEASIQKGRANIFRGELWGLSGYEFLDVESER